MAVPTFFGAGTGVSEAAGASALTPGYPASTQANDIAIAQAISNLSNTITCATSGWASVHASANSNMSVGFFWKRLTGGDASPQIDFSAASSGTDGHSARVLVYRGVRTSGDPYTQVLNTSTSNTATPATNAITTGDTDCLVVNLLSIDDNSAWSVAPPPAGGWCSTRSTTRADGPDAKHTPISLSVPTSGTVVGAATIGTIASAEITRSITFDLVGAAGGGASAGPVFPRRAHQGLIMQRRR